MSKQFHCQTCNAIVRRRHCCHSSTHAFYSNIYTDITQNELLNAIPTWDISRTAISDSHPACIRRFGNRSFQHRSPSLLAILSSLASMSSLLVCITRERAYSQIASRRVYRPIYWIKPTRLTSGRQLLSRTTIVSQHCIRNTNTTVCCCICVVHVQCNS